MEARSTSIDISGFLQCFIGDQARGTGPTNAASVKRASFGLQPSFHYGLDDAYLGVLIDGVSKMLGGLQDLQLEIDDSMSWFSGSRRAEPCPNDATQAKMSHCWRNPSHCWCLGDTLSLYAEEGDLEAGGGVGDESQWDSMFSGYYTIRYSVVLVPIRKDKGFDKVKLGLDEQHKPRMARHPMT